MKIGLNSKQGRRRALIRSNVIDHRLPAVDAHEHMEGTVSRSVTADGIAITCYHNLIPPFVEDALEQRYGALFSSLAAMKAYDADLAGTSVFMATRDAEIVMVWLFQRQGKGVRVLNESIAVNEDEATRFADWIFASFPEVETITINCADTAIRQLRWPLQTHNCSEDSVLELPAKMEDYLARLGKTTRKNIHRYTTRLKEQFPTFQYSVTFRDEIDPKQISEIVRLNRLRMMLKGKVPGITPADQQAMLNMARRHGMLLIATIDGRICAGALVFQVRDNYFSFVRTHDPAYNQYRLGLVGACLMIQECIARQGKELHFMWGREPHKAMLLGVEKPLFRLTIYRSRFQFLLNLRLVLANVCEAYQRRLRTWLVDKMHRDDDAVTRIAGGMRRLARRMRGQES